MSKARRILALAVALVLTVGMLPTSAFAAEPEGTEGHVHTADCYAETLTCGLDEHTHGEDCYTVSEAPAPEENNSSEEASGSENTTEPEPAPDAGSEDSGDQGGENETSDSAPAEEPSAPAESAPAEEADIEDEPAPLAGEPAKELTCALEEHTHGEGCYEQTLACGLEESEETEAPENGAAEETPAQVQAFLDAAAALPGADQVNKENAEAIGQQVDEALALYETLADAGLEGSEGVAEALETVYAVYEAALAAEEIEGSTFNRTSNVTKSPYEDYAPNKADGPDLSVYSNGMVPDKTGAVTLNGDQKTATDYLQVRYYTNHGGAYATGYTWLTSSSRSSSIATAKVSQSILNGKPCLKVDFEAGSKIGTTTIEIGYTVVNLDNEHGIGVGNDFYMYVSGYVYYTVTNNGDGVVVEPEKPAAPNKDNMAVSYVYIQCKESSAYVANQHSVPAKLFYDGETTIIPGEVVENSGNKLNSSKYPYQCTVKLNGKFYETLWNKNLSKTFGSHKLYTAPKDITFYYDIDRSKWTCPTAELYRFSSPDTGIAYGWLVQITKGTPVPEDTNYTVVREYWLNGQLAATVRDTSMSDKIGDTIVGDTLVKNNPNWNTYKVDGKDVQFEYKSSKPEQITLVSSAAANVITLRYEKNDVIDDTKITVTKTPSKEHPFVGEEFKYTIEVTNDNDFPVVVKVTDKLAKELEFSKLSENANDHGVYDKATHTVTWENITVPAYGSKQVLVWVKAKEAGEIYNEAKVKWETGSASGNTTVEAIEEEDSNPTPPTPDEVDERIKGDLKSAVVVNCQPERHQPGYFEAYKEGREDRITIGEVQNSGSGYTCEVIFHAQEFCDAYNGLKNTTSDETKHTLVEGEQDKTVVFKWNAEKNQWELPKGFIGPVTFCVKCPEKEEPTPPTPKIKVVKENDGFKVNQDTGNASVNYTVDITNLSGYDIYGLRLTDVMDDPTLTKVNPSDVGEPSVKLTFKDWKVDGRVIAPMSGGANELTHVLQLLERGETFADGQTVKLTYTVEIENLNDEVAVKVKLDNEALGASWSKAPTDSNPMSKAVVAAFRTTVMPVGDEPDVTDKDTSTAGGTTGDSSAEGELPRKYSVTYSWTGLPSEATETAPGKAKYLKGATVVVDTAYTNESVVTVGGETYEFSGWNVPEDVNEGAFTMPAKNVEITGVWTKTATPSTPIDPESIRVRYLVQWLEKDTGDKLKDDEIRGPEKVGTEVQVTDADKVIEGYTFDADNSGNILDGTLSKDEVLILKLYFNKDSEPEQPQPAEAQYTVNWYVVGQDVPFKGTNRSGKVGEEVSVTDADKIVEGYTFAEGYEGNVLSETLAESGTVLKLYFNKNSEPENPEAKEVEYTVVHEYWTNGTRNDSLTLREGATGKAGDEVKAESIEKKPTAGGNSYSYTSASPESITLTEDAEGVITLRYDRTTGGGDDDPTPPTPPTGGDDDDEDDDPVPTTPDTPDEDIPEEDVPLTNLPDPEAPEADLPKTPDEVIELEDPEVPLADMPGEPEEPEIEIPEEDAPLSDVPKTGDATAAWALLTLLSGAGMAFAGLGGKKRDAE